VIWNHERRLSPRTCLTSKQSPVVKFRRTRNWQYSSPIDGDLHPLLQHGRYPVWDIVCWRSDNGRIDRFDFVRWQSCLLYAPQSRRRKLPRELHETSAPVSSCHHRSQQRRTIGYHSNRWASYFPQNWLTDIGQCLLSRSVSTCC